MVVGWNMAASSSNAICVDSQLSTSDGLVDFVCKFGKDVVMGVGSGSFGVEDDVEHGGGVCWWVGFILKYV